MARVIYIEKHESIEDVLNHFGNTSEKQVILVVPKKASLFESADYLSAVKLKGDELGKHITIISLDIRGLAMAEAAGLEVSKLKRSASEGMEHPLLEEKQRIRDRIIKFFWIFVRRLPVKIRVLQGIVLAVIFIFGGAFFWYATIARTDIYLKSATKPLSSNVQIMIDSRVLEDKEVDGQLIIPGRLVTRNITIRESFPSTGKKIFGDTASGKVTFYNFTEDTITIKSEDTVLRYKDLRFRVKVDTLRVRPTAFIGLQGKKIDPTSLVAPQDVEAEEMGEAYNLPSETTLEVINSKLNFGPTLLYAQNDGSFLGGSKKEVRVIDATDADTAARILSNRISNEALGELSKLLKKGEKLVQDKFEIKMLEQNIEPTLGSKAETFTMKVTARVSGLVYDRIFLEKLVKNKIKASVPADTIVDNEEHMISFSLKDLDLVSGRAQIANEFIGTLHPDFDNADFKYTLRGKNEEELKSYFKNQPMVESVDVKFSPTWFRRASWLSGRIFIRIE